jgi:hypothetical protein
VTVRIPLRNTYLLGALVACALVASVLAQSAHALEDDGGATWRLEQPAPPAPPPGVEGSTTPVGLGRIGDIEFWAPNRGLLSTAGNGSTVPPGIWAYNGREWHELATVCGATDGRIAWAGAEDFWTVSDGRPGQAPDAHGNPPRLEDNTLCHFQNGRVSASYATLDFKANSYLPMHAAACISTEDCWFGGDLLAPGQVGAFHLRFRNGSIAAEPYTQEGHAVEDMRAFEGQLIESVRIARGDLQSTPEPPPLHAINPAGVQPIFEPLSGLPLYAPKEFPEALDFLHLSAGEGALWAAAGLQREPSPESVEGQLTVVRFSEGSWTQLLGPATEPSGESLFPKDVVKSIAAEPGGGGAWMALDTQTDSEQPSPTAPALVARISPTGAVSAEDRQELPLAGQGVGAKGAASKITCPAPHDCWLATTQGWLFHLTNGQEELAQDTDPAFAGLITERPLDEGIPQTVPDSPPPDDSGLPKEGSGIPGSLPESPITPAQQRVSVALLSHIHTRIVYGNTLELKFHLAARARVRLLARRRRALVASTPTRTLAAGNRKLLLRLNVHRWPTKLELKTHPLAPLPTVSASAGATETVSTSFLARPGLSGLLP